MPVFAAKTISSEFGLYISKRVHEKSELDQLNLRGFDYAAVCEFPPREEENETENTKYCVVAINFTVQLSKKRKADVKLIRRSAMKVFNEWRAKSQKGTLCAIFFGFCYPKYLCEQISGMCADFQGVRSKPVFCCSIDINIFEKSTNTLQISFLTQ